MIIFCEAESHEGCVFVETVCNHGSEKEEDNESHEGRVATVDSGSLETRNKKQEKTNLNFFLEQKVVVDQQRHCVSLSYRTLSACRD